MLQFPCYRRAPVRFLGIHTVCLQARNFDGFPVPRELDNELPVVPNSLPAQACTLSSWTLIGLPQTAQISLALTLLQLLEEGAVKS